MTNFVRDNLPLPATKTDLRAVTDPTRQWGASDANTTFGYLSDLRSVYVADVVNVRNFGAKGDDTTDDTLAILSAITAAAATVVSGVAGAMVYFPPGSYRISSGLLLPAGVGLRGDNPAGTRIVAAVGFNDTAMIANQLQTGNQEFAFLERISIEGNKGSATCTVAAVNFVSLFVNSYIRDVVIQNSSSIGLRIAAAGSPGGTGPVMVDNVWVGNCGSHNVMIEEAAGNAGAATGLVFVNLTSEHQATNCSAVYLKGVGNAAQWNFYNTHIEMGNPPGATGRTGITLDGVTDVLFSGVQLLANNATVSEGIKITNVVQNARFTFERVYNPNLIATVIRDLKNGTTMGAVPVPCYIAPDTAIVGGQRFLPTTGGKSLVVQRASDGADRSWFDDTGTVFGTTNTGASLDVAAGTANGVNSRVIAYLDNSKARAFGFTYPDASFIRFRCITGGADVWDADNTGNLRTWGLTTFGVGTNASGVKGNGVRAAAPSTGTHVVGEVVFNVDPVASGKVGWVCITAGTPGTWKAFGPIDP